MIAPTERRARVSAALYVLATAFACLFPLPVAAQLGVPVLDAAGGPVAAQAGSSRLSRLIEAGAITSSGFRSHQLRFPRVRQAYDEKGAAVRSLFVERGVVRPAELFLRVFKREQLLEVWARARDTGRFALVRSYPVCQLSGRLGPKRREGDGQVPEGFYSIDLFNPWSDYHLSMRVDYPNAVDRFRSGRSASLGGDIFIHGGCATIGCVPIGDEWMEELYLMAVEAREAGQRRIPIHIFPTRLDGPGMRWLAQAYGRDFVDYPLWENLQEGFVAFERTRSVPTIATWSGRYVVVPGRELPSPLERIASLP